MGGFGLCGVPECLTAAIRKKGTKNLTVYSNEGGLDGHGAGQLIANGQISKFVCSFMGLNKNFEHQYFNGDIEVDLVPQGTLVEMMRAGGAGIPAFFTKTGVGSFVGDGGIVNKFKKGGKDIEKVSQGKEMRVFNGQRYIMVESIKADYGLSKGHVADELGNVIFNKSAYNFNGDVARAAKCAIVEVEEIVPAGSLDPAAIQLPQAYVHRIVKGKGYCKPVEQFTISKEGQSGGSADIFKSEEGQKKKKIAERAAQMVEPGMYINLGIGVPVLIANFIDTSRNVTFQTENGILGVGEFPKMNNFDPDLINAGKQIVTVNPGAAYMSSCETFAMIRGSHLDITFLGGMQVSEQGDLANWIIPGKMCRGMGGAMDLVAGAKKRVIVMQHAAKNGGIKILRNCSLPLTGQKVVNALITEKAVFQWNKEGKMVLTDVASESSVEDVRANTDANYIISDDLKIF